MAQPAVLEDYGTYRFFTLRRHNDIQGVEAVYDDYRRNWLRRHNTGVVLGNARASGADTPVCSYMDTQARARMTRFNCGNGHVFRFNLAGYGARDGSRTSEVGAIGYLGYEHLVSDRFFLGVGTSFGSAQIDHQSQGVTLDVTTRDVGVHVLGGYRFPGGAMLAWNWSYIFGNDEMTQNGAITSTDTPAARLITGVWYKSYDLRDDLRLSVGLDYTLYHFMTSSFVASNGQVQELPRQWRGDVTPSFLFTRDLDNGEAFTRIGSSIEILQGINGTSDFTAEFSDITADFGRSFAISDKVVASGTVGGSLHRGGATELRASVRLVARF